MSQAPDARQPHLGLHHITAICADPARNLTFYGGVLGLRLIKKTVNFDDPTTYHLYYGDQDAAPGSVMTFFPWPGAPRGRLGRGAIAEAAFAIAAGGAEDWARRLADAGIETVAGERFGHKVLTFVDPDGMPIALEEAEGAPGIQAGGILRLAGVSLMSAQPDATRAMLEHSFGAVAVGEDNGRLRLAAPGGNSHVDLVAAPAQGMAMGVGTIHHVAFRAADEREQDGMAERLAALGLSVTERKDRNYFRSIYLREPGGAIVEIATDGPGFAVDEPLADLGKSLKLPAWLEPRRAAIEAALPPLPAI